MSSLQAAIVEPNPRALRFTELLAFRGDFGGTEVVNPKGIVYHPTLNKLIVSISPYTYGNGKRVQLLNAVASDSSRSWFAPGFEMFRDIESMLTVVPLIGPPIDAGFTPGDLFVGRGPGDEISRLSDLGTVLADVFVDLGTKEGTWGGLTFDTHSAFGGRLVVATRLGKLFLVDAHGKATLLTDLGKRLEGVAVSPKGFGPLAGHIIVSVEGVSDDDPESGKVYAVDQDGQAQLLADIGFAAEDIRFVPEGGGTYYQCELAFDRERENRVLRVSSSQFLSRLGTMLIVNEMGGDIWQVSWDGNRYTQSLAGRVPGRWSSQGFDWQGTELEAGCFASRPPVLPGWSEWRQVPGELQTDLPPAASFDIAGNLHLLSTNSTNGQISLNSMRGTNELWSGWYPVLESPSTKYRLAMATHNEILYAFAVRQGDGAILYKRLFAKTGGLTAELWTEVPGEAHTDTAVVAVIANGRLVLALRDASNQRLLLNELAPGGRNWGGWSAVPDWPHPGGSPSLAAFNDELFVIMDDPATGTIILNVRSAENDWTGWITLPADVRLETPVAATTANQLYLFAKEVGGSALYLKVSSDTGTWSNWEPVADVALTDSFATNSAGYRIYLLVRRPTDRQVYVKYTY